MSTKKDSKGKLRLVEKPKGAGKKAAKAKATGKRKAGQRVGESSTSPRRLRAMEKQLAALELRKTGMTFEAIAKTLGYQSRASAFKAVMTAIKELKREPAQELVELELARLDAMLAGLWPSATTGDARSVDSLLRLSERRARLLGLDEHRPVDEEDSLSREIRIAISTGKFAVKGKDHE